MNNYNTFYTKLDIDTAQLSKVRIAEIFFQQSNVNKLFKDPNEYSLFGYNLGLEMADNMIFILNNLAIWSHNLI